MEGWSKMDGMRTIFAVWELSDWLFGGFKLWILLFSTLTGVGILYLIYLGVGSSLRREERARCFLHLLEVGLKRGQSIEHTIISLAQNRVQTLGVHFHLLAAYLETGVSLTDALEKVPRFLPPQVRAMLQVGREIGDVSRVLPACRKTLRDAVSGTQSGTNNLMVLLFISPVGAILVWVCANTVLPRFKDIVHDFEISLPAWTDEMFTLSLYLSAVMVIIWLVLCIGCLQRAGGLPTVPWLGNRLHSSIHRFRFWLPWRHKRMRRDFSAMLALLLDSEVPEDKALSLAAASTANLVFVNRAERVIQDLRSGVKLTEAVHWLDDAGEFRWRLRNASPGIAQSSSAGFFAALAGWHESLEAKAFQQEQAVSQALTTGFLLLNGLIVGLVAVGIFRLLLVMVEEVCLW